MCSRYDRCSGLCFRCSSVQSSASSGESFLGPVCWHTWHSKKNSQASAGADRGGPYPFKVYRFPEPSDMQVVLLESHVSHTCLEDPRDIGFYADMVNHLRATAFGELRSQALIEGIIKETSA